MSNSLRQTRHRASWLVGWLVGWLVDGLAAGAAQTSQVYVIIQRFNGCSLRDLCMHPGVLVQEREAHRSCCADLIGHFHTRVRKLYNLLLYGSMKMIMCCKAEDVRFYITA